MLIYWKGKRLVAGADARETEHSEELSQACCHRWLFSHSANYLWASKVSGVGDTLVNKTKPTVFPPSKPHGPSLSCSHKLLTTTLFPAGHPHEYICACVLSCFSCVWLFATPWTVAWHTPLSMGFSRQEYWNGLPFPSPGNLPDPGIESTSPALAAGIFFTTEPPGKPFLWIQLRYPYPRLGHWAHQRVTLALMQEAESEGLDSGHRHSANFHEVVRSMGFASIRWHRSEFWLSFFSSLTLGK